MQQILSVQLIWTVERARHQTQLRLKQQPGQLRCHDSVDAVLLLMTDFCRFWSLRFQILQTATCWLRASLVAKRMTKLHAQVSLQVGLLADVCCSAAHDLCLWNPVELSCGLSTSGLFQSLADAGDDLSDGVCDFFAFLGGTGCEDIFDEATCLANDLCEYDLEGRTCHTLNDQLTIV